MFQSQTFGKLDYSIVMTFIKSFLEYYVGSDVVLSNNQTAKIISLNILFNEIIKINTIKNNNKIRFLTLIVFFKNIFKNIK